jgi:hypothetical protein
MDCDLLEDCRSFPDSVGIPTASHAGGPWFDPRCAPIDRKFCNEGDRVSPPPRKVDAASGSGKGSGKRVLKDLGQLGPGGFTGQEKSSVSPGTSSLMTASTRTRCRRQFSALNFSAGGAGRCCSTQRDLSALTSGCAHSMTGSDLL